MHCAFGQPVRNHMAMSDSCGWASLHLGWMQAEGQVRHSPVCVFQAGSAVLKTELCTLSMPFLLKSLHVDTWQEVPTLADEGPEVQRC